MNTAIDINTCTLQEACDYAVQKIVEQGGRSLAGREGVCAYESPGGRHCAIGWLLDHDDPALMEFEGTLKDLIRNSSVYLPKLIKKNVETLSLLQRFHDSSQSEKREEVRRTLTLNGVDTSGGHWQKWVEMGGNHE